MEILLWGTALAAVPMSWEMEQCSVLYSALDLNIDQFKEANNKDQVDQASRTSARYEGSVLRVWDLQMTL